MLPVAEIDRGRFYMGIVTGAIFGQTYQEDKANCNLLLLTEENECKDNPALAIRIPVHFDAAEGFEITKIPEDRQMGIVFGDVLDMRIQDGVTVVQVR
jgi:hypothetical protein